MLSRYGVQWYPAFRESDIDQQVYRRQLRAGKGTEEGTTRRVANGDYNSSHSACLRTQRQGGLARLPK
jgi:hypothetical protein